jgi:hypothetical protein
VSYASEIQSLFAAGVTPALRLTPRSDKEVIFERLWR